MGLTVEQASQGLAALQASSDPIKARAAATLLRTFAETGDESTFIRGAETLGVHLEADNVIALGKQVGRLGDAKGYLAAAGLRAGSYNRDPRAISTLNRIGQPGFDVNNPAHIDNERGGHVSAFEVAGA